MAVNKRLIGGAAAAGAFVPSEHFGVVLYEGDGSSSHSINGGKFGAGAYFNGSSSKVDITATASTPIDFSQRTFTISAWINGSGFTTDDRTIISKYNGSNNTGSSFFFDVRDSDQKLRVTEVNGTSALGFQSGGSISENTWTHVVYVRTATTCEFFINGSSSGGSQSRTTNLNAGGTTDISIGERQANKRWIGKIDQVRIFSKALSSSEVSTLYAETLATSTSLDPLSEDTTDTLQVLGDSSCLATYQFENDETDLSGNYDATGYQIQYAAGRYGQAASFDGSNSYIQPSSVPHGSSFAMSFWFKTTASDISIYTAREDSNNYFRPRINSSGNFQASHKSSGTFYTNVGTTTVNTGVWFHVVINFTSSDQKVYLNGQEEVTNSYHSISFADAYIGASYSVSLNPTFDGELDQMRFFNKALSASEVTTLYNENSLVASYRFEGNANDDTRNYDGTASNVTYEYGLNGFTPDFVWIKERSAAESHRVFDSSRGATKRIFPNTTGAESTATDSLTSFDTGGFSVGSSMAVNQDGEDYVAWCFKANGGTTSSNTDGNITSTVQVNETAGFSIIQYTSPSSPSSSTDRVGHGLGTTPAMVIVKRTDGVEDWYIWHKELGGGGSGALNKFLRFNTDAQATASNLFNTVDSTVVNLSYTSTGNLQNIAYAFAEVEGFSKFGSYTGNGVSGGGPIIETGFEPAFVMIKNTNTSSYGWYMFDNKRSPNQEKRLILRADTNGAEYDGGYYLEFLSNGFRINTNSGPVNLNNGTFIFMAFAADADTEQPAVAKSFSTVAYTGNSSTNEIDGLGFQPNLVWLKSRNHSGGNSHVLLDSIRGTNKVLIPNSTGATWTTTDVFTSFDSDGFTLPSNTGTQTNQSGYNYVAWAWKADDNEPTINTEGSIDSIVSANANAGFSIVKYTGTGSNATVGHGLSSAPELLIIKQTDGTRNWLVSPIILGNNYYGILNSSSAFGTDNGNTNGVTSTVINLLTGAGANSSGGDYIAYCFHSVSNYSKFGSYTGNGSSSGPTVTLGFQADWILIKRTDSLEDWKIIDSVRGFANSLEANESIAEETGNNSNFTITSTGFQIGDTHGDYNANGGTYIYAAFKIN